MAQKILVVTGTVDDVLDILGETAEREGYTIDEESKKGMVIRKGNLAMSILLGIFVGYCSMDVKAKEIAEDEVRLKFEWTGPWWQGLFGPMRARKIVQNLVDLFEKRLKKNKLEILEERD
jgi:hypothetical protein